MVYTRNLGELNLLELGLRSLKHGHCLKSGALLTASAAEMWIRRERTIVDKPSFDTKDHTSGKSSKVASLENFVNLRFECQFL